jgi:hypothetical protein
MNSKRHKISILSAILFASSCAAYADNYSIMYTNGVSGASFSDAKATVESDNKARVIYQFQENNF